MARLCKLSSTINSRLMLRTHTLNKMLQTNFQARLLASFHKENHSLPTQAISTMVVRVLTRTTTKEIINMAIKIKTRIGKDQTKATVQEVKWGITTDKTAHFLTMRMETTIMVNKIISMIKITVVIIINRSPTIITPVNKCKVTIRLISQTTTIIVKIWVWISLNKWTKILVQTTIKAIQEDPRLSHKVWIITRCRHLGCHSTLCKTKGTIELRENNVFYLNRVIRCNQGNYYQSFIRS